MKIPIGLQLYSIREAMEKDFWGSLEKVKAAGYDCVEFAGYGGHEAPTLKERIEAIGLAPYSSHVGWQQLAEDLDGVIDFSRVLGLKWLVCPGHPMGTREDIHELADLLRRTAAAAKPHGIQVAYHNHSHEFVKIDDRYGMDWLLQETGADVHAELDVCWVQYANVDPEAYLDRLGTMAGPLHCKDINADYEKMEGHDINVEVGNGMLDFENLFKTARKHGNLGKGLIVEQEAFTRDPFESIGISCDHIVSTLARMGIDPRG